MPLTTRLLALRGEVPVSPLLRDCLRAIIECFGDRLDDIDLNDRMAVYEGRNSIYLQALAYPEELYQILVDTVERHHCDRGIDPTPALQTLALDRALCPRRGGEQTLHCEFNFDAASSFKALSSMEQPDCPEKSAAVNDRHNGRNWQLTVQHPGGIGEILFVADGGSWLQGVISPAANGPNANESVLHYSPQ